MIVGSSCLRGSPQHSSLRGGRTTFRVLLERDVLIEPVLKELAGLSLRAIAAELDRRGIKSWSGKPWNAPSVKAALVRLGLASS